MPSSHYGGLYVGLLIQHGFDRFCGFKSKDCLPCDITVMFPSSVAASLLIIYCIMISVAPSLPLAITCHKAVSIHHLSQAMESRGEARPAHRSSEHRPEEAVTRRSAHCAVNGH